MTTTASAEKQRQELFNAAINRISRALPAGLDFPGLKSRLPALNASLEASAAKLNDTWVACMTDMATMAEFKAALDAWEAENYKAGAALKAVR